MTPWDEYVATVVQLDGVRREADTSAEAQRTAVRAASEELATVRARIALQRGRLTDIAALARQPSPAIEPLPTEREAAAAVVAPATSDPTPGVGVAIQGIRATLDAADATLSAVAAGGDGRAFLPGWPPAARYALVYGWHALLALVAVIEIANIVGTSPQAQLLVAACAVAVPAGAWLLGWITVRVLFGAGDQASGRHRGPPPGARARGSNGGILGAAICAVPVLVGMFMSVV
jgi:hypothetical protein